MQVQQRFSGGEEVKSCRGGAEKGMCKCAGAAEVQVQQRFSDGAEVQRSGVQMCWCRSAAGAEVLVQKCREVQWGEMVQRCRGQGCRCA